MRASRSARTRSARSYAGSCRACAGTRAAALGGARGHLAAYGAGRTLRGWRYIALVLDCRHQPLRLPAELIAALAAAYTEPHRRYHDATHIAEVLGWYDRVADDLGWHQPAEVYVAIVFHDAIYTPGANDNEARSAAW